MSPLNMLLSPFPDESIIIKTSMLDIEMLCACFWPHLNQQSCSVLTTLSLWWMEITNSILHFNHTNLICSQGFAARSSFPKIELMAMPDSLWTATGDEVWNESKWTVVVVTERIERVKESHSMFCVLHTLLITFTNMEPWN